MSESTVRHTAVTMSGRDPHERGRTATPLELLFDLTFVIAFGTAADELAHLLAAGHVSEGIVGFCFATFAVSWAWINFAWFASAYDTDDWVYRLTTMVQMVGVIVLALGLPRMFASLEHGEHVDNGVMVLGYVIMRVPMIAQWMRAARQDPDRREVCKIFILTLTVSQVGWIVLAFADTSVGVMFAWIVVLVLVELVGPFVAEHVRGGTPWHAHHIAERYGLMVIIALGEGLLGTTAALGALIDVSGWTTEVAAARRRRRGHDVRAVVDVLRHPVRRPPARLPLAVLRLGLRPHPAVRRDRRRGRGPARRGVLPRAPLRALGDRHPAHRGDPGLDLPAGALPPVRRPHPHASTRSTCC